MLNIPNIPTDPICMWTYIAVFVLSTVVHRMGLLNGILGPSGGSQPAAPAAPVSRPILTGIQDVVQFLRSHRELMAELQQLAPQIIQPQTTPPTTPAKP